MRVLANQHENEHEIHGIDKLQMLNWNVKCVCGNGDDGGGGDTV